MIIIMDLSVVYFLKILGINFHIKVIQLESLVTVRFPTFLAYISPLIFIEMHNTLGVYLQVVGTAPRLQVS